MLNFLFWFYILMSIRNFIQGSEMRSWKTNAAGSRKNFWWYSIHFIRSGTGDCPGTLSGSRSRPSNPHDRDRDRDSKPRDSRDRDKNQGDSPDTKIPRDNESRHFGTRIPLSAGTVPLSRDSTRRIRFCHWTNFLFGFSLYVLHDRLNYLILIIWYYHEWLRNWP